MQNPNIITLKDVLTNLLNSHDSMCDKTRANNREFYKRTCANKIIEAKKWAGLMIADADPKAPGLIKIINEIDVRHSLVMLHGYKNQKANITETAKLIKMAIDMCQAPLEVPSNFKLVTKIEL